MTEPSTQPGTLYVVATPIGNLGDISARALATLASVDLIAAEDTRHSAALLRAHDIATPMRAYHDFSKAAVATAILDCLQAGESVALISDAGTPLISDPGFKLVRGARERGIAVLPIPGPSALIAALSVAGLPTDRFVFEGFLPNRDGARRSCLQALRDESRTLVFFEAGQRMLSSLRAIADTLGDDRRLFIGRELTKRFETHVTGSVAECIGRLEQDADQRKGEFVMVLAGHAPEQREQAALQRALEVVTLLQADLSLKRAVALASQLTGARKNALYDAALQRRDDD